MKKIGNFLMLFGIAMTLWIVVSWIDINTHNHETDKNYLEYNNYNFFIVMFGDNE